MATECDARQHDELCARVVAVDIRAGVRLRVPESASFVHDGSHLHVAAGHCAQDVIRRAVENAGDAHQPVAGQPLSHAMNQRHAPGDCGLEAELRLVLHGEMQEFGRVRREQHLVGGHNSRPLLEGAAHPAARRIDAADHFDNRVGLGPEQFVQILGPRDRPGHPADALAVDAAVEDMRELKAVGQLGPFADDPGD